MLPFKPNPKPYSLLITGRSMIMDHHTLFPCLIPPRKLRSSLCLRIPPPNADDDDDQAFDLAASDVYASDEFRMYEFKVRRCTRARSHDWTDCPFAHPGEKARRRDPRKHHYSAAICPSYKNRDGHCPRGDSCEFAHGVFECWLHPARYRTTPCKDGRRCRRKVCFFAHTRGQLRVLTSSPTSTLAGFGGWCSPPPLVEELVNRLEGVELLPAVAGEPDLEWVDELLLD